MDARGTHLQGDLAAGANATRGKVIAFSVLAVVAGILFVLKVAGHMPDFEVYWRAGVRAAAGEGLYRPEDGHYQFKYLPAFAVLMLPLGALSLELASAVWFTASVVLLVALFRISLRLLPEQRKPTVALVIVAVVALGKCYAREFGLGQVNLLFVAAAAGALLALKDGREKLAGSLVAFSLVVKPYGIILLPWLLARQRPAIWTAGAGLGVALALPLPLYGVAGTVALHQAWLDTVVSTTSPNLLTPENVSWLAMYTRWFGPGRWTDALTLATVGGAMALGVGLWAFRKRLAFPEGLEGAYLLLLIPFISPQGWDYVLLVGTPAILLVANYLDDVPRTLRWLTLVALSTSGLIIYDVLGREGYHWFLNQSGVALCFAVVIAALVTIRARRIA